ncbi:MAG: MFS transporter [Planctomycetota bacterium]
MASAAKELRRLRIPLVARYTWKRHWPAAALEGLSWGVVGLGAFAVKRSLGGPDRAVPLFIALWQGVWIFTPAIGTLLARADPQRLWRGLAVAAYLPVLLVGLVAVEPTVVAGHGTGNLPLFLLLMFLFYATAIGSIPHRGALLRTNYPRAVRGRMWGYLTAVSFLAALGTAKLAAHLLDRDPRWLRVVFPAAALLGALGFWKMGRIRWRHRRHLRVHEALGMREAWREAWRILREDSAFRTYEIGFMLYGCGFLCSIGLLILYAEDKLGLSYGEWTTAQFLAFPAAQVVGAALLGRLSDRLGIVKTTALAFGMLGLFFGVMSQVGSAAGLIAAYALFGFAMAGVGMGWSLGPLHFSPARSAHMYTAVHFSLVGVRSLFAPALGWLVKRQFSYSVAFGLSVVLIAAAMVTVWRLARRST